MSYPSSTGTLTLPRLDEFLNWLRYKESGVLFAIPEELLQSNQVIS